MGWEKAQYLAVNTQQGRLVSVWTNVSLTWDELMSKVRHCLKIYNVLNMSEW